MTNWKLEGTWPTSSGMRYFRRIVDGEGRSVVEVGTSGKEMRAKEDVVVEILAAPVRIAQLQRENEQLKERLALYERNA